VPVRRADKMHVATADIELARRLEQSISLAPMQAHEAATVMCGPFRAFFAPYTDNPELSYAMPVAPMAATREFEVSIENLRALFAERGRTLRFEFVEELWPNLAIDLERMGLHLQAREPLMACSANEFRPSRVPDVGVRPLLAEDADDELDAFLKIRDALPADGARRTSATTIARLRETLSQSNDRFALATIAGQPAGTGRCIFQAAGLGEITAIVTTPAMRRRGVAAAVVSFLLNELFENGGDIAWLNAANEQARSVYARLGFRSIGSLLNYEA